MTNALQGSTTAILRVFDKVYQTKTGNASLFDKSQRQYLQFDSRHRLIR